MRPHGVIVRAADALNNLSSASADVPTAAPASGRRYGGVGRRDDAIRVDVFGLGRFVLRTGTGTRHRIDASGVRTLPFTVVRAIIPDHVDRDLRRPVIACAGSNRDCFT